jgi:hypothetical protein
MGVYAQIVVAMSRGLIIGLARLIHRIGVQRHPVQAMDGVEELMADFLGNGMPLSDGKRRCDRYTEVSTQPMAYPAGLHLCDSLHARRAIRWRR